MYESHQQPRLKTLRLPIAVALEYVEAIEELDLTPSEACGWAYENPHAKVIECFPIASIVPIPPFTGGSEQKFKPGSPAEIREKKCEVLRIEEEQERTERVDDSP